jgi:hypothetical protein
MVATAVPPWRPAEPAMSKLATAQKSAVPQWSGNHRHCNPRSCCLLATEHLYFLFFTVPDKKTRQKVVFAPYKYMKSQ